MDEKLTVIYLRSMQRDYFDYYRPVATPIPPHGWLEEYQLYKSAEPNEKSALWRDISGRFLGYIKASDEANTETASHKHLLKEMLAHFQKLQMFPQAATIKQRLLEFQE